MKTMTKEEIYSVWAGLGIAFGEAPNENIPPERAIIETIKSMNPDSDRKIYSLMILWLSRYEKLIRFEPIYHFMEELDSLQLRILGSLALKLSHQSDRWSHVVKKVKKEIQKGGPIYLTDERKVASRGSDPDFEAFSLILSPIAESTDSKLRPWDYILKHNYWLRFRREGGTNLRSDIRAVFYKRPVSNPYQAAKLIGCRPNSVYESWNEIAEVQNLVEPSSNVFRLVY